MEESFWHTAGKWPENVDKTLKYPNEPLFKILDNTTEKNGDFTCTIFEGVKTSYSEVRSKANKIANFLINNGVQKGDRIALFLPNVPMYPIIFFGILKAGATAVTCNPMYTASELNFQLTDSGAKIVFCLDDEKFTPICYNAVKNTKIENVVVCSLKNYLPKMKSVFGGVLGKIPKSPYYKDEITTFFDNIMVNTKPLVHNIDINPEEDLALILYTGGTTGTPKGAMLTHKNLYSNILQHHEFVQIVTEDTDFKPQKYRFGEEVLMGALPWYHSYGLTLTMLVTVYVGGQVVVIPDPRAGKPPLSVVLQAIEKYKVTVLHAVPTLYAAIINHPNVSTYDLSSLRACGSGAAPLPPELAKRFEAATGATLFEGYGLTETSPVTHANPTDKKLRKFGTVGFPLPDTYVKIVDLETGTKELPLGEDGEIALAGPQIFLGYWKKPEQTEAVFREIDGKRFFLSGDIGHLDEEGFTVITDRKKDMINVSGLKAYPREIEDILFEHPKVQLAAAVGIPRKDDPSNEYVKAFIVLKDGESITEEAFIEWCRERMAGYKRPKEVEFRETLPISTVGKVLRRVLRDEEAS
jgi:long-chain acyl-CoA synthetase